MELTDTIYNDLIKQKCDIKRYTFCGIPCHYFNDENGDCEYENKT